MVWGKAARAEEPGWGVRPGGPAGGQAEGCLDEVGGDGRRMAAPPHAGLAGVEPEDRTPEIWAAPREGLGHRPTYEQAGGGERSAEVPVSVLGGPGAIPTEPVTVDQPAGATDLEILDDPLELEPLRQLAAIVPAG